MDRSKYPPDWEAISKRIRFERAGGKCEACGIENHLWVHRGPDGWLVCAAQGYDCTNRDVDEADGGYADHPIRVVLTVAHLDHDTTNNADSNLMAMCQRCHLRYDAKLHGRNAKATRIRKSGQGVLL